MTTLRNELVILEQCPHCGIRRVQVHVRHSDAVSAKGDVWWHVARCQNSACQRIVLMEATDGSQPRAVFPFVADDLQSNAGQVPPEIKQDFWEAAMCLGAGCHKASLVMSRRVLQRCLKDQGCEQRNLVDAIKHAVDSGILRKAFHSVANEIREYGNLGAHPDDEQLINANGESAQHVLSFARVMIHEFYEIPAAAAQLRKNRETPATS